MRTRLNARKTLEVRAAREQDARRLADLSGQLGYPSTHAEVARRLSRLRQDPEHVVYVVENTDGEVIAWVHAFVCHLLETDAQAEVSGLVVDEAHRGSGAGRALMQRVEKWAREKGCWAVRLRSNVIRQGAHAFYERLGYEMVKTQRVFRRALS